MESELENFSREIDASVGPETEERANTENSFYHKADTLPDVDLSWKAGRYEDALTVLSDSLDELQRAQNGIGCMQKSIDEKQTACDKKTFRPIDKGR